MTKVTYKQLVTNQGAVQMLAGVIEGLVGEVRLRVARLVREVDQLVEDYNAVRGEMVDLHTKRGEDGKPLPFMRDVAGPGGEMVKRPDPNRFHPKDLDTWRKDSKRLDVAEVELGVALEYGDVKMADLPGGVLADLGDLFGWEGFAAVSADTPARLLLGDVRQRMEKEADDQNHDAPEVPVLREGQEDDGPAEGNDSAGLDGSAGGSPVPPVRTRDLLPEEGGPEGEG